MPKNVSIKSNACQLTDIRSKVGSTQDKLQDIEGMVMEKMLAELESGTLSAYNAAGAFASLVNAVCKLERLKLEIVDRLNGVHSAGLTSEGDQKDLKEQREVRQLAEALLLEIAKQRANRQGGGVLAALNC